MGLLKPIEEYENTYLNLKTVIEELLEFKEIGVFSNCEKRVFWSIINRLELHVDPAKVVSQAEIDAKDKEILDLKAKVYALTSNMISLEDDFATLCEENRRLKGQSQ